MHSNHRVSRRTFLKTAATAVAASSLSARSWAAVAGANSDVRVAIVGVNSIGRYHTNAFRTVPGVRVVALCDVDTAILEREAARANASGPRVDTCVDMRDLLARSDIDALAIGTPNHLHALQAIWCMQAGKDVFLEKPVSHNIWEGAQLVAAAKKYGRIVQVNTQNRSSGAIDEALAWVRAGHLGKVTLVRGIVYKRRASIGKVSEPMAPPATVNYDLFMGPAPLVPPRRARFHYDWHWQWATGNGDIVAQGNHQIDIGRRFLGDPAHPAGVFSIGGRFGYDDDGETPNTFVVHFDYPTPYIFEVRGLPGKPDELSGSPADPGSLNAVGRMAGNMDQYRGMSVGNVVECEGGYLTIPAADYSLVQAFDREGRLLQEFHGGTAHYANFVDAVRSRRSEDLRGPILQGHLSSALAHIANVSYLTGRSLSPEDIRAQIASQSKLAEPFGRLAEHLAANQVDLAKTRATWGAPLRFDAATEKFVGEHSAAANKHLSRDYRAPYVVPQLA